MKKNAILLLVSLLAGFNAKTFAQGFGGLFNSNYSPTNTMYFNPASIADSRQKFQMNLFSFNGYLNNNQAYLSNISDAVKNNIDPTLTIAKTGNNSLDFASELRFLPSFVATLNPKHSIGFGFRTRSFVNILNIPSSILEMYTNANESGVLPLNANIPGNFSASTHTFSELNGSYGVVLLDKGEHVLKAGINAKYLSGLYNATVYDNSSFTYEVKDIVSDDNYNIRTRNVDLAFSTSEEKLNTALDGMNFKDVLDRTFNFSKDKGGRGFGVDVGFEYEWRPQQAQRFYEMDGKQQLDRSMIPYKLKIGAAITDLGKINYSNPSAYSYQIKSVDRTFNINQFDENDPYNSIKTIYANDITQKQGYSYSLPTSFNFSVDYNINNRFFVAGNLMQGITNPKTSISTYGTFASIVPRYEVRKFSASIPVSYISRYSDRVNVGLALRAGFFFIGTDDLGGLKAFGNKAVRSANVYAGLNFSIPHKRLMDKDGDGISDKFDKCPEVAGPAENNGCPWEDKDNDGVPDKDDKCPDLPGSKATQGCPDKDGDGIADQDDKCPDVAGLAKFQGCPDSDGDGVPDAEDRCPDKAGVVALKGCPDKDGDGVADMDDKCPDQAGPASNGGCPIIKEIKKVVTLTKVEEKIVFTAVQNLQFETGKSTIKKYSYASLDELAKLMNDKEQLTLLLSGHTDNVGSKALNQKLSENRAEAVKMFLVNKGVAASRITAVGYGMDRPVVSNATAAGRAKNRRVEFKVE